MVFSLSSKRTDTAYSLAFFFDTARKSMTLGCLPKSHHYVFSSRDLSP